VALVAGCSQSGSGSAATQLTIDASTGSATTVLSPSEATLTCGKTSTATGFLRSVAEPACQLVRSGTVQQVVARQKSRTVCAQVYAGPQTALIKGTINDQPVNLTITRADSCGTAEWQTLLVLLGDPEREGPITAVPTTAPTTTTGPMAYVVKRGDTLTSIARQFGVSVASIVSLNQLASADQITEGQTLEIPAVPPVVLKIAPAEAQAGTAFVLSLTGAQPSENVTFKVMFPDGTSFTGASHAAGTDGTVTATYNSSSNDIAGTYTVVAHGDQNTTAQATFVLDASTPAAS
jgi:LysM repeat protein